MAFDLNAERLERYLPWRRFENHVSGILTDQHYKEADKILHSILPRMPTSQGVLKLFRRNVWQVLGVPGNSEGISKYVICWTPDGCINRRTYKPGVTGGTGIAILVAEKFGVPVWNLALRDHKERVLEHLKRGK